MKRLMIFLVMMLLVSTASASSFWFGGAKYTHDSERKWTLYGGRAVQLSGGLYSLPGVEIDLIEGIIAFRTVGIDLVYLWRINGGLYAGLLASPAVDWETNPPGDPLAYITGAAGVVAGYNFGSWGVAAAGRYKAGMDSFSDDWQVWGGIVLAIGD